MDVFYVLPYNAHVFFYLLKHMELITSIFLSFEYTLIIYFCNSMIATSANNAAGQGWEASTNSQSSKFFFTMAGPILVLIACPGLTEISWMFSRRKICLSFHLAIAQ